MEKNKYEGTQTEKNLMEAFAGESQARNKLQHRHNLRRISKWRREN